MMVESKAQVVDTLQLKNGQLLIGEFKGWNKNEISFDIADIDVVDIESKHIHSLNACQNKYRIETSTRKVYYSYLKCEQPGEFIIVHQDEIITIPFHEIQIITPYLNRGKTDGYIALGYNFAKSNGFGLIALDAGFNFSTQKLLIQGEASSNIVHNQGEGFLRNREMITVNTYKTINAHWQFGARNQYQRNTQLGLAYRHLMGLGVAHNTITSHHCKLYLFTGLAGMLESTLDKQRYERIEIPLHLNLELFQLGVKNLSLSHTQTLFTGTNSEKRFRHDATIRLSLDITESFSFTTYLYYNYDSAPVLITAGSYDYGWNSGIKYEF
jgi:hypothetical protein